MDASATYYVLLCFTYYTLYTEPFHCEGESISGSLICVPPVLPTQAPAKGSPLPPPHRYPSDSDARACSELPSLCPCLPVGHPPLWREVDSKSKSHPWHGAAPGCGCRGNPLCHIFGCPRGGVDRHSSQNQVTLIGTLICYINSMVWCLHVPHVLHACVLWCS